MTNKVEITCPHCSATQMESASALSTYCRKCGGHIKLGQALPGRGRLAGLMDRARGKAPSPATGPTLPALPPRSPAMPFHLTGHGEQGAPLQASAANLSGKPSAALTKDPPRVVHCFECENVHKVAAASTSTICPGCSTYIDLRDLEIKDRSNKSIRTRGDVIVEKKGALLGTSITCGHLTLHGTVSGSIYASGDILVKTDQRILGEVRCRHLLIEKKCEVHCLQPVHAGTVEIHGRATGHFFATRSITLRRHAVLDGSVTAQFICVEPGAVLNGQVLVQHPEPPRPDPVLGHGLLPVPG